MNENIYKNAKVRCWKIDIDDKNSVFITYPESSGGHELIICTNCGEIYAVDILAQQYIKSPDEKIADLSCKKCNQKLSETYKKYPENYLDSNGKIGKYTREQIIPDDKLSIIKEFPSIY